jgi:hypothetical protein
MVTTRNDIAKRMEPNMKPTKKPTTPKEAKMARESLNRANRLDSMDPKGYKCGGKMKKMKKGGKC